MRSFWSDPYLWVHLAGLAAFPLFLEGCLVGFAMGDPLFPVWLELLLVFIAGSLPILWMQWKRPFYIFSLVAVSLKPAVLTDDQRRLLTLFKSSRNRVLAVLAASALLVVLQKVYAIAPIASSAVSFLATSHWLGLFVAAVAFLACNLFVQVPLSVASVMLCGESAFARLAPYPPEQIRQDFSLFGVPLNQILPPVLPPAIPEPKPTIAPPSAVPEAMEVTQSPPTEPLTSDLWSETSAAAPDDSPNASDVQALEAEAETTVHSYQKASDMASLPEENLPEKSPPAENSLAENSLAENSLAENSLAENLPEESSLEERSPEERSSDKLPSEQGPS